MSNFLRMYWSLLLTGVGAAVLISPAEQFKTPMHTINVLAILLILCGLVFFAEMLHASRSRSQKDGE